ncbi:multicopper oxidase domain-containing protein [Sediminibacterium sp.]|uniref:multicopper oxidase domain-containing protein n=1 Tax=Sediminibacterium sp. TaxID=1917865 RepID=UPI002730D2FF|nr:multicopper oxidase domain-containing protein [Sediminibacterium sp.]MDP2421386.1 multicopper oxidase domain-containing protein [Sediminibacterium sp.]
MRNFKKHLLVIGTGVIALISCRKEINIITSTDLATPTVQRVYYIAAEEVEWNYVPTGINQLTGGAFGKAENVFLQNDSNRIGNKNIKAIYVEYTDATFATKKPKEGADLGIVGPIIRAEVGDSIQVIFKNKAKFPYSIHPHGVVYDADNEGIAGVAPGSTFTYKWRVTENSGPAERDGSSIGWVYHSHVMEHNNKDINAGLVSSIVIYKKGYLENNKSKDIDNEKFALFMIVDENNSLYLDSNKAKYTLNNVSNDDPNFQESNLKHSVNGLMYGNCKFTNIKTSEKVRWYLI